MAGITVDLSGIRNATSQQAMNRGQYAMTKQAFMDMNENFVPYKDGNLRNLAHVDPNGQSITWEAPYAQRHYYTQFGNYTTPGTGPRWDLKAKGPFMPDWISAFMRGAGF